MLVFVILDLAVLTFLFVRSPYMLRQGVTQLSFYIFSLQRCPPLETFARPPELPSRQFTNRMPIGTSPSFRI
jgi:hypothetical protein